VVQPGENLFRIGLKFDISGEAVAAANGISDPTQLSVGTMLIVPVAPPRGSLGYYVQPGDTLYAIATRFGVTVEEILAWSGIGAEYEVAVGQVLTVQP
jgi:LysM repeat protein